MISMSALFEQDRLKVDPKASERVEKDLSVKLPNDYGNFLNKFGYFSDEVEINGTWKNDKYGEIPSVVFATIMERKYGLSNEYVVIRNFNEWFDSINTIDGRIYEISETKSKLIANTFRDYLKDLARQVEAQSVKQRLIHIVGKI